eukprot:11373743-Alexandrium_andersonii.AAC.1
MCIRDRLVTAFRGQREQWHRTHPSGASGTNSEAAPGPVQFKLRSPEAVSCNVSDLHVVGTPTGSNSVVGAPTRSLDPL